MEALPHMKKNVLAILAVILSVLVVTILLPAALIAVWPDKNPAKTQNPSTLVELDITPNDPTVDVYLTGQNKLVTMPLEAYVRGVVAAEMPVHFQPEALKAQAVAARTYIVRRMANGKKSELHPAADVSDNHNEGQAYSGEDKLKTRWGAADYQKNLSKINAAINATKGQIALYEGKPIEALFFSTSSGKTENSEDYWGSQVPYLRSVDSPWDAHSDKFTATQDIPLTEFYTKLGLQAIPAASIGSLIKPLERSATEHIKKIQVGDKTFTGPDFRGKLGLRSTLFTWQVNAAAGTISFFTKGFGHGVGLSQYGANGMAQDGKKWDEIIRHYYQGVTLGKVSDVLQNN
ncbi:stage II sporulation protein D [Tumebacillus avium]|uniref:Stage II sporulation protein D n=2 Tax=Tumebacillus avium TaxID=1903704 RepID=A0A1Y0IL09_9BACL|nr:stage II sporulation protein D [Tumebacillus avium]